MEVIRELLGSVDLLDGIGIEELVEEVGYLRERHKTQLDKYDKVEEELHSESYDEYSSSLELRLYGIRQKTQEEIDKEKTSREESKAIRTLANDLDVSYHEASILVRLKNQGKIK